MIMPKHQPFDGPGWTSRDFEMAAVIRCSCRLCAVNKDGFCEVPSLIEINARGVCETGLKYMHDEKREPTS